MDGAALLVTGVAAQTWPRAGCACAACLPRQGPVGGRATGLQVGDRLHLSGTVPDGGEPLTAGEARDVHGVRLLALPAGDGNGDGDGEVVLVIGFAGRTVLWAPTPGVLAATALEALEGAGLDAAALDVRAPDGRPDPLVLAHNVARLRQVGALGPCADVVAVGLTHELGSIDRVRRRLALWGVRVPDPGGPLAGPQVHRDSSRGRRTLVLGAASSGKSAAAEDLLAAEPAVVYAATGPVPDPQDADWSQRVGRHRDRRPPWWQTVEAPDLPALLRQEGPPVLLDSLGAWVTATLTALGAWDDVPGWAARYDEEVDAMVRAWRASVRVVVAVGEETGWGVVPATSAGRRFRDALGLLTHRLADESEHVQLVVAGRVVDLDPRAADLESHR